MAESRLPKIPAGVSEAFLDLVDEPINFHPAIARLCGSAQAGLMLSQAYYWSRLKHIQERGGWFYKSSEEWEEETCLSRREQDTAKKILREKGFLITELKKVNGAPTLHFKVAFEVILKAHFERHGVQMDCTNQPNPLHENAKSECTEAPNGKHQSAKTIDCTKTPNPVHQNAKSYKEAETSSETSSDFLQGGKKRPAPPGLIIAREKLSEYIQRNGPSKHDPEYDRKMFHCILAGRGGLSPTQVKEFLGEDPMWRKWPFWEVLDSQKEIEFPEPPPKPQPAATDGLCSIKEAARWWKTMDPNDYERAKQQALKYIALVKTQDKEQIEAAYRELKGCLGTAHLDSIYQFVAGVQREEATA